MAEYIEREVLMKQINERYEYLEKERGYYDQYVMGFGACCDKVESVHAADVAPVKHGRWKNGDPYCPICRKDKFRGLDADVWADWQPYYCPNCGARMDGVDEE